MQHMLPGKADILALYGIANDVQFPLDLLRSQLG